MHLTIYQIVQNRFRHIEHPLENQFLEALSNQYEKGLLSYSEPLTAYNGRDPLQDAKEELVDAYMYLIQAKVEGKAKEKQVKKCEHLIFEILEMQHD